jgi:hypothetical protein
MAITHVTAVRNAAADAVVDRIDAGVADANGDLVLMAAGDVEVATLEMANPAYGDAGAAVAGRADSNAIADDTNATGGTLALFKIQDRDNGEVFRGTVTGVGGGGDIEASSATVNASDTVQCTGLNYAAPA